MRPTPRQSLSKRRRKRRSARAADRKSGQTRANGKCVTGQGPAPPAPYTCAGIGDPFCFDASGKHECICQTRLQGGTVCGVFGNASACDQCQTDSDCLALGFPVGSSCTQDFGPQCQLCQNSNKGICTLPCGVKDPT